MASTALVAMSSHVAAVTTVVALPVDGTLTLELSHARPRAHITHSKQTVSIDAPLAKRLRAATDLFAVAGRGFASGGNGRTLFVLGVATPSVDRRSGAGYCGSGSEDELLLVEWRAQPPRLTLWDRLPVQSCLEPMALRSDQGNELRVALRAQADPERIFLDWLQHPRYGASTKTVTVASGRFVVAP